VNRSDLLNYVMRLTDDARQLFNKAEQLEKLTCHDTLSEDYQLAAEVLEAFNRRAAAAKAPPSGHAPDKALYVVTGVVVEGGMTRGRQLLLLTEDFAQAQEYKREHEAICGKQAPLATVLFQKGPQVYEILILKCPVVG
jgi:hypothetical protein